MAGAGDFLSKQVGPLPMGVWLLVGGGGLALAYWQRRADAEPDTLTAVQQVPVPVGALGAWDGAPLVITPIIRLPDLTPAPDPDPTPPPVGTPVVEPPPPPATVPGGRLPRTPGGLGTPAPRSHTVKTGDTLWMLATRYYANPLAWRRIYETNAATIDAVARSRGKAGGGHWIFPGTVLVIP